MPGVRSRLDQLRAGRGDSASLLVLQAQAGNAAVAELVTQVQVAAPETAPATTTPPVAVPPEEGTEVDRFAIVDNDREGAEGGLNLRDRPGGRFITKLGHNQHLMVKRILPNDWRYVVVTGEGPHQGLTGYGSKVYINDSLPPDPSAPDTGAQLHRIQSQERAHDFVRRHYGAQNIKAGQDQRFFTNVLMFVNERAGRGRHFRKVVKMRRGGRGMLGQVATPYEDIELVAGGQIWVPSLPYAEGLKGVVSAGSWARDTWEKVKDIGEKLAAVPAFIAGLAVGALESIRDLFVGLFEMVWQTIKTLGRNLIDAAKAIYDLVTDPAKRRMLLEMIDEGLTNMLYRGSFLRRAYNWGRIIGYATMEVVAFILFAGATAALRAGKFGARLSKLFDSIKQAPAIQKTLEAADKLRRSEAVARVTARLESASARARKVVEPVAEGAAKAAGAVGKVVGAPGTAVLATSRAISRQLRRVARRYGWSEQRLAAAVRIVEERGARVYLRQTSKWAPARIREGALPKPVAIKANTLDELDLILGGERFKRRDLGLVAHFDPVPPSAWRRPRRMKKGDWEALQPELNARYNKRRESFAKLEPEMQKLSRPTTIKGDHYYEVRNGKVYQLEVTERGTTVRRALTGDIDVVEFRRASGGRMSRREYEMIDDLFLEAGVTEHGAHMAWRTRKDYNEDMFFTILERGRKEKVVEIGPGGSVRELTVDQVPGVAEVFASPEYAAWKARTARRGN